MNYYHYTARKDNGLMIQGWLQSRSREEALTVLQKRQLNPLVVKQGPGKIPLKVPLEELYSSMRELSGMRLSGMPLEQAVSAIRLLTENKLLKRAWVQIEAMLQAGLPLSEALASQPEAFPDYTVPMVKLGEANGELAQALTSIAQRMENEQDLISEIKTAIAYPSFLIIISFLVVLFLFLFVIPQFSSMVEDSASESNMGMAVLVGISQWLRNYYWLWGSGFILLMIMLKIGWRNGQVQATLWNFIQYLPVISTIVSHWEIVQFTRSMQRLLGTGINILEALELSSDVINRQQLKRKLENTIDDVRKGQAIGKSMAQYHVFPNLVIQMISIGEQSANLPKTMEQIGDIYEKRMRNGIKKGLTLLEPAVIVLMGGFIGVVMITLMSSIIAFNDIPL